MRGILPAILILLSLLAAPSTPATDATGVATLTYEPTTTDGKAFFFHLRMNPETRCVVYTYRADMATGQPIPWLAADAVGLVVRSGGQEVPLTLADKTLLHGDGSTGQHHADPDTSHRRINVSVGPYGVYETYQQTGYDETDTTTSFSSTQGICDVTCRTFGLSENAAGCAALPRIDTVGAWLGIVMTPAVHDASVTFDFYETFNFTTSTGTHGAARGHLAFAADSNRTFLKELKDFDGTYSHDGDPDDADLGATSAGFNLQARVHAQRGMFGGIGPIPVTPATTLVSYEGPGANVGASLATPLQISATTDMSVFQGDAGDWTFRVHAHADVNPSWLFLWGADIETG